MSYLSIMLSSLSAPPKAHNNTARPAAWLGRKSITGLVILLLNATVPTAVAAVAKDPFAQDTWHAINTSWPGTIKFNGKTKKVVLQPVGSEKIEATYSYRIDEQASKKNLLKGSLTMVNTMGQVSTSEYTIENDKNLKLTFKSGQQPETYVRMSPAEEAAEVKRLSALVKNGTLTPMQVTPSQSSPEKEASSQKDKKAP